MLQAEFVKLVGAYQKYLLCCCSKKAGKKSIQEAESGTTGYLFVIQPSFNSEDDDGADNRSDPAVSMLHKVVEQKFHDLDNFLNKKLLKTQQDQAQDMRQRLDGIER